jgi:hypothetical protein
MDISGTHEKFQSLYTEKKPFRGIIKRDFIPVLKYKLYIYNYYFIKFLSTCVLFEKCILNFAEELRNLCSRCSKKYPL